MLRSFAKRIDRFYDWLGLAPDHREDSAPDPLISLSPYEVPLWPSCTPRIGETFDRYCRRARMSRERALLVEVWKVTAEPDYSGEWKTAHDRISRKRDELLRRDGFAS